jgi:hypothetical protein
MVLGVIPALYALHDYNGLRKMDPRKSAEAKDLG